jgi:hypothetical protein
VHAHQYIAADTARGKKLPLNVTAVIGITCLLAACGGGGGGGGGGGAAGATAAPAATTPITRTEAQVGDYFVYSTTTTQTLPATAQPTAYFRTDSYLSIANDGTSQRVSTYSNGIAAAQSNLDVNDGQVGRILVNGGSTCSYTPALQTSPPYPRSVGQTWSGSSVSTCGTTTGTFTHTGKIVAHEPLVVPAGTFDSYRAEITGMSVTSTSSVAQQLTCWYSVQRGAMLKCDYITTQTPATSTTPNSVASNSAVLTGLGGPTRVAQGNVLARFTGSWRIQYTGSSSGNCAQLEVTTSGGISGSCTAASSATFNVTGSVNDFGAVTLALSTGGSLTGTLTTPYAGLGNWTDGSLVGTWTASHN